MRKKKKKIYHTGLFTIGLPSKSIHTQIPSKKFDRQRNFFTIREKKQRKISRDFHTSILCKSSFDSTCSLQAKNILHIIIPKENFCLAQNFFTKDLLCSLSSCLRRCLLFVLQNLSTYLQPML